MEVRYHLMRPAQIVKRRKDCPAVYIPLGTIEWHGVHNATGADSLQAEGIAVRCAQKGGGLVFPPLYYGEPRVESLMEADAADRDKIAAAMELDPENFTPARFPYTPTQQAENYQRLLVHILAEAESLGFKVAVLIAGHYPLIDYARAAVLQYAQRAINTKTGMVPWAFSDYLLLQDSFENAGDHAAAWETSHMLALMPETVDLSLLPPEGVRPVGVIGPDLPQGATAAFGEQTMEKAAELAINEVAHRLAHPEKYLAHGFALREGLWKK